MSNYKSELNEAYELIQQEQEEDALDILVDIVREEPANSDAWWLISYAVDDPKDARLALVNVLKNNPQHQKARDMLRQVNEYDPPTPDEVELLKEVPDAEGHLQDISLPEGTGITDRAEFNLEDEDLYAEMLGEDQEPAKRRALPRPFQIAMIITMLAIVVILAIALLNEAEEADEDAPGRGDLIALQRQEPVDALADLQLADDREPIFAETALGTTLFVETCVCVTPNCGGPGPQKLPQVVLTAIQEAAEQVDNADASDEVQAVGVNVVACLEDEDTLYRAFAPYEAVSDYENLTLSTLQANSTIEE